MKVRTTTIRPDLLADDQSTVPFTFYLIQRPTALTWRHRILDGPQERNPRNDPLHNLDNHAGTGHPCGRWSKGGRFGKRRNCDHRSVAGGERYNLRLSEEILALQTALAKLEKEVAKLRKLIEPAGANDDQAESDEQEDQEEQKPARPYPLVKSIIQTIPQARI